ncbi:hypothetical protein RhiirC2_787254 [Rhizophagus irregularis]|uniref:Uncharacterized protein n=1 Tax=Rhizophagus irregularis TaxID=588596 RepID=A0A2N1MSJ6_9GLOM|nr:hypothetical protein RhiirC2_787254 [Rhizophagus irregularis]
MKKEKDKKDENKMIDEEAKGMSSQLKINSESEIDWSTTLRFISNRNAFSFYQYNESDTKDRSYKIKNLIKELPTYAILMKRKVNGITTDICPRCNDFSEDWEHIWICETNEIEIDSLIKKSICEYEQKLSEGKKNDELKIMKEIGFDFIDITDQPSLILIGKKRIWELLRTITLIKSQKVRRRGKL